MMSSQSIYVVASVIPAVAALVSVYVAKRAMEKGLTYSVLQATLYTLIILAIARIWHTVREVSELKGEWPELVEYGLNFLAYAYFITVAWCASCVVSGDKRKVK